MVPMTPLALLRTLASAPQRPQPGAAASMEPDWCEAYGRLSTPSGPVPREAGDDSARQAPAEATPLWAALPPLPWPRAVPDAAAPPPAARAEPASPTVARMADAARRVAEPAPPAAAGLRTWQVELPGVAAGWQLHIEQQQPQAPLALALHVPPAVAAQARQQLADLDRRLRDAGHELLRSRLRPGGRAERLRPVDEVGP